VEIPELADLKLLLPARRIGVPLGAASLLLVAGAAGSLAIENRQEAIPRHAPLSTFPLTVGEWTGVDGQLAPEILDQLKLTDYLMVSYSAADGRWPVELYVAYYGSQRTGVSVHSPRACLPGGGWQIEAFDQMEIEEGRPDGSALAVNRALISLGDQKALVYYWFMQRGRYLTNEYLVKWYIFWDSLTRNRTDGAMVRVTVPVGNATELDAADLQAAEFIRAAHPKLYYHIPQESAVAAAGTDAAGRSL
jgi:EpsI family protein